MEKDIEIALFVLRSGGTILYPTDTIWGIGCDATDPEAVKLVHEIKNREDNKGLIVLVDDPKMIKNYVEEVPQKALDFIKNPKEPTTIIYPKAKNLAPNIIANDGSVGIRVVDDEFCRELIRKFKKPLVSTSANYGGTEAPANFKDIHVDIVCDVDYVVKWGQGRKQKNSKPSKIIRLMANGKHEVIREA